MFEVESLEASDLWPADLAPLYRRDRGKDSPRAAFLQFEVSSRCSVLRVVLEPGRREPRSLSIEWPPAWSQRMFPLPPTVRGDVLHALLHDEQLHQLLQPVEAQCRRLREADGAEPGAEAMGSLVYAESAVQQWLDRAVVCAQVMDIGDALVRQRSLTDWWPAGVDLDAATDGVLDAAMTLPVAGSAQWALLEEAEALFRVDPDELDGVHVGELVDAGLVLAGEAEEWRERHDAQRPPAGPG